MKTFEGNTIPQELTSKSHVSRSQEHAYVAPDIDLPMHPSEDPLQYLPYTAIAEHRKGEIIFREIDPATSIYFVVWGAVKITRMTEHGEQALVDIRGRNEFFGESALLNQTNRGDRATALEYTQVMVWTMSKVAEIIEKRPGLGIALMQTAVRQVLDFKRRIQSFASDHVGRRLIRNLIYFAERVGVPDGDCSVHIMPLTHTLLSQYVGTSREVVTHHMGQLRHRGYLRYSAAGIDIRVNALKELLQNDPKAPEAGWSARPA